MTAAAAEAEVLTPGSPAWGSRVSPSKLAAVLGLSPWESPRSLWHRMRGEVPWALQNEAQERGNLLEPAVLAWWRSRYPDHTDWREQVSLPVGEWFVATLDAITELGGEPVVVEAKTSTDYDAWGEPGTDEVPLYYLTQIYAGMHAAHLCGIPVTRTHVPVLGPQLRFENYVVEYDAEAGEQLFDRGRTWWDALAADEPPPLDDSVATFDAIRRLHPEIESGQAVELSAEVALALVEACAAVKAAEAADRLARSTVIELMGRAQYATWRDVRIARRQPRGEAVSFVVVAKPTDLVRIEEHA